MGIVSKGGQTIVSARLIIAISGRMASGKTTLADALAAALDGATKSFGDYVRHLAAQNGGSTDRGRLQEIGQSAVEIDAMSFLERFFQWASPDHSSAVILDGLRHVSVRDALRHHAAQRQLSLTFVHVEADDERRYGRLRSRGDDDATLAAYEAHISEMDARNRLRNEADVIIQRSENIEYMVAQVLTALDLSVRHS